LSPKHGWVLGGVLLVGAIGCAEDFDHLFSDGGTSSGDGAGAAMCTQDANCMACTSGPNTCTCNVSPTTCDSRCETGTCVSTCNLTTGCAMECAAGATCILKCPYVSAPVAGSPNCNLTCEGNEAGIGPQNCGEHGGLTCNRLALPTQCND
jgi:hypothetical protein